MFAETNFWLFIQWTPDTKEPNINLCLFFLDMSTASTNNAQAKRKEIYKYEAPWMVFAMNWSIRPDKRFRLALGSFVEEYNNKVNRFWWSIDVEMFFSVGSNRFIRWRDFRVCGTINIRSSLSNHESDVDTRYCKNEYPRTFDHRLCLSSFVERCFSWSVSDEWRLLTRLANEW